MGTSLDTTNRGTVTGSIRKLPSEIRAEMREAMAQRIGIVLEIADNPTNRPKDRLAAIDLLGKYGLGARFALEVAAKMAERTPGASRESIAEASES